MSKTEQIVYISSINQSKKHYHTTDDQNECYNVPDNIREVPLSLIEGHYHPCSICAEEEQNRVENQNCTEFECQNCGTVDVLHTTGVRTLSACQKCEDMTTWERIDD